MMLLKTDAVMLILYERPLKFTINNVYIRNLVRRVFSFSILVPVSQKSRNLSGQKSNIQIKILRK